MAQVIANAEANLISNELFLMYYIKILLTNIKIVLYSHHRQKTLEVCRMKDMNKLGAVITKILEVFHWVGAVLMAAATVCSAAAPNLVNYLVGFDAKECCGANLEVYGFEVNAPVVDGNTDMLSFMLFGVGAVIILSVMAMVFRNLYLIFKKSENGTPFQKDNIRMMKEIGIFSIAVPVIGLIMSTIVRLAVGVETAETSVDMSGVFMGIIVLCLTQFFVHGADLEKDVDGLL